MTDVVTAVTEESLDPGDWEALRRLGHRMVDDLVQFQRTIGDQRVWTPAPPEVRRTWEDALPQDGVGAAAAYDQFRETILPYGIGNLHPRFWGWVTGTGSPGGMLAGLMAGGMNAHAAFGDQVATHIERQVLSWCAGLLGLPADSGGVMVTSGSMANLTGLIVARDHMLPQALEDGVRATPRPAVIYASQQVHSSVDKAAGIIGLGRTAVRKIPVDADYRIRIPELQRAIAADREVGLNPIAVIGTAGTVNTGAIDDLGALAAVARQHGIWFHVDAAFGVGLATSARLGRLIAGIELADSIAFDFHKWFYVPYDAAAVLVRDRGAQRRSFAFNASYLAHLERGIPAGGTAFNELGVDLSRGFRSLKVWMTFKEHGIEKFGRLVEQNVDQAGYLASLVERHPRLELTSPVAINVVTFRYVVDGASAEQLNDLNREILMRLHEGGQVVPSFTVLEGRFVIRIAIVNHRSVRADFDLLVEATVAAGDAITRG